MKYLKLLAILLFFTTVIKAQKVDSLALKYANTINAEDLDRHLSILASDEYEGRETGKKGQKMAMEYLIKEFKKLGIADYNGMNYIQEYPLIEQQAGGVTYAVNHKEFKVNEDFFFSPSFSNDLKLYDNVVFVGYGIDEASHNSYKNIDSLVHKAVFLLKGTPKGLKTDKEWTMKEKIALAKEKGAEGVFYYDENFEETLEKYHHYFEKPKTKLKEDADKVKAFPVVRLGKKAAEHTFLVQKVKFDKVMKKGLKKPKSFEVEVHLDVEKENTPLQGENVLGYIPGTDKKEELIVITAHYDHIGKEGDKVFNGADDDGTGTSALIEIAEAFMMAYKDGNKPRRSILIMPVSGEEKGLLGSKYYTNHPVFPLENTVANLNVDMIGRYDENHLEDSNYIYLIGADKLSQELHDLSEEVNDRYTNINLDYTFNDENDPNRFYYRSDHYNFAKNNVPVIFYFSGVHEDYHKETDTVEKIDFDKTAKVSKLIFLTAWELANREERIKLKEG